MSCRWDPRSPALKPQSRKLDKLKMANSVPVPWSEIAFNGFILRNYFNQDLLQEHPSSVTQNTTSVSFRCGSLPNTEPCHGMPPSIYLLIIYSVLLWSLIADARWGHRRSHFHLIRSSPVLSMEVVSIRLWPTFPKSLADVFLIYTLHTSRNKSREESKIKGEGRWSDCHLPLHSTAF